MLRSLHLLLAFCVLISSVGASISEHLCSAKGRAVFIFQSLQTGCCSQKSACSILKKTSDNTLKIQQKPCCQTTVKYLQQGFKSTENAEKTLLKPVFLACNLPNIPFLGFAQKTVRTVFNSKILRFRLYKPPPLCRDIPVLIQSFLC
jgi:hypothetical protein